MTRLERLALWALLTLGLCGCTRTVETRAESALRADVATRAEAAETVDEVVQTGPSTKTIYRFALPDAAEQMEPAGANAAPIGAVLGVPPAAKAKVARPALAHADGLPAHGPLVEVEIDQTGPILAAKHIAAQQATATTATIVATAKTAQRATTSYWPPAWLLATLAGLLALGLALLRGWLKMPFGL